MKFQVLKEKISKELSKAERMTGKNLSLPVLESVLLEVNKNNLIIRGTNLDLGIEINIPVSSESDGRVAVPAKIIQSYLNSVKDDEKLVFSSKEGVLEISSSSTNVSIKTMPDDEYPLIPKIEAESVFSIKSNHFVSGLKSVVYASSISSMKPELASVYVYNNEEGELLFVATDSFRLAEKKIKTKDVKIESGLLIPFKNCTEIIKICEEIDDDIEVSFNKNQLSISHGNMYMVSRVVDGVFPDYEQIIPKEFSSGITVLKQDILNAFKIINIFSDKFNQVNIKSDSSGDKKGFTITSKNNDIGETQNKINAAIEGEDVDMNFNYRYIVDSFQSLSTDSITFNFSGNGKPLVITGVGEDTFRYLVMPMNK